MHGIKIQVVRRLVEQQRRRIAEKRLRQQHAHFLPALQFAHLALVQHSLHAQAVEQHRRIRLRRIPALFTDDAFELPETHPIGVRQFVVRLDVQRVAFFERLPQGCIPHNDRVDDAVFVKRKLILPQNTHLFRPRDRSAGRVDLPSQNLHERGLARAIRPGDGVAAPGHKGARHILEENTRAEAHGDVIDREHNPLSIA